MRRRPRRSAGGNRSLALSQTLRGGHSRGFPDIQPVRSMMPTDRATNQAARSRSASGPTAMMCGSPDVCRHTACETPQESTGDVLDTSEPIPRASTAAALGRSRLESRRTRDAINWKRTAAGRRGSPRRCRSQERKGAVRHLLTRDTRGGPAGARFPWVRVAMNAASSGMTSALRHRKAESRSSRVGRVVLTWREVFPLTQFLRGWVLIPCRLKRGLPGARGED